MGWFGIEESPEIPIEAEIVLGSITGPVVLPNKNQRGTGPELPPENGIPLDGAEVVIPF